MKEVEPKFDITKGEYGKFEFNGGVIDVCSAFVQATVDEPLQPSEPIEQKMVSKLNKILGHLLNDQSAVAFITGCDLIFGYPISIWTEGNANILANCYMKKLKEVHEKFLYAHRGTWTVLRWPNQLFENFLIEFYSDACFTVKLYYGKPNLLHELCDHLKIFGTDNDAVLDSHRNICEIQDS